MDLQQRVERLERQNYWLQGVAVLALSAVGLMFFLSEPRPSQAKTEDSDTIEAKRFILRDADGKKRAELSLDTTGFASFQLLDKNENGVASLEEYGEDGAGFLSLSGGKRRNGIVVNGASRYLYIYGAKGKSAAELRAGGEGPVLELTNAEGNISFTAP